jgi:hypothetical protein
MEKPAHDAGRFPNATREEKTMLSKRCRKFLVSALLLVFLASTAWAQEEASTEGEESRTRSLQLSLFKPYQIHDPETSISGLRWNVIYGVNQDVSGLDVGIVNIAEGALKGLQLGGFNEAKTARAWQLGLLNSAEESRGIQVGAINHATEMNGLQLGLLYNSADTLKGLQVGLFNFVWNQKVFFLPIVNGSF